MHVLTICRQASERIICHPQDSWDRFVEANWAPTLQIAFGKHWKQTVGSEVPAMMQLSQHPGRQLTDSKSPSSSWSRHDPNASTSHSAGRLPQNSPAFSSALNPQYANANASQNSAPMGLQVHQRTAGNNRNGAMDEWADIFDQCKTAITGSDPSQGGPGQQEDPRAFAGFMPGPGGAYAGPPNGAFESAKSLNSEEAEDCMFGESDDEGCHSSGNGGPQRLPYFGGIADWPSKQMPHLPVSFCHFWRLGSICCLPGVLLLFQQAHEQITSNEVQPSTNSQVSCQPVGLKYVQQLLLALVQQCTRPCPLQVGRLHCPICCSSTP